jgi:hypothetical protein
MNDEILRGNINGVKKVLDNPNITPEELHNNWVKQRTKDGWVYGEVKDQEKKTHPDLVPYDKLPYEQKIKDKVFLGIVK